ncbi:MAG: DUF3825 domain-containing protein [Chitinophagaceae bacterium]|nr:DUF3825 domain-containing protein [Chitinophagaceae bacterium]
MVSQQQLLEKLGSPLTNKVVDRLHKLIYIPVEQLEQLAKEALHEEWGNDGYALEKYLAVQVPWSIEQNLFTCSDRQWYVTAGNLQTRYGTPLYLAIERNQKAAAPPFYLRAVGSYISAPALPSAPKVPEIPAIPTGAEIVMMHDHILGDNEERVQFLKNAPPVAQMCAISGAIQWSLNRSLQLPYWYFGRMQFVVPLYLKSRENIAQMPDLVAPIQINPDNLLVRTVLAPHMPYANARVSVKRHDQLPPWLIDSWKEYSKEAAKEEIENPEKDEN